MSIDCSPSGYAAAFQQHLQNCMKDTPLMTPMGEPEAYWVGKAAVNAFKEMSSKCLPNAGSAIDCTPKGYALAVVKKIDPEKKIVKMAVSKVSNKAAKNLGITAASVGCAAGAIVGGAVGAFVTLPEGAVLGAVLGGAQGCVVGAKIGPVLYNNYKIVTKIEKHYNTAVEVKKALKEHSNACKAHPLFTPPNNTPPKKGEPNPSLQREQSQASLTKDRLRDRSMNSFTPKPIYSSFIQNNSSPFHYRGSFPQLHYPYLHPHFNPPIYLGFSHQPTDYWRVQNAVKNAISSEMHSPTPNLFSAYLKASLNLGMGYTLSLGEFRSVAASTSLISSYNSFNPFAKLRDVMNFCRDIGGVGNEVSVITDMIDSAAHAEAREYFFCFPAEHFPFSPDLLKQLMRELAEGYFNHKTVPFFSLHFNDNGFLYPVIHPAYKNTLVGEIIALLDYWMKGYLNGGVFDEKFLKIWHDTADCNEAYLRSKLIDLKKYCKEHCKDVPYISLRELMSRYGLNDNDTKSAYRQPFMTSFRIIASQEKIERRGNVLIPHPTFRVEYSIDLMPDYKNYLESYCQEHGQYPEEYQKIRHCYKLFAEEIKEKLPKLPFCRDFFRLLGNMNFFCYFYATLNHMGKRPVLEPVPPVHNYPSPKAFPPIPVRYYRRYSLHITFGNVIRQMQTSIDSSSVDGMLVQAFATKRIRHLPEPVIDKIRQEVTEIIKNELTPQMPPNEPLILNEDEVERITQIAQSYLRQNVYQCHAAFHHVLNRLMVHLNESELQRLLPLTLIEKMTQTKEALKLHLDSIRARWTNLPALAKEEIFKEIPPNYHQIILDNFKKIEEDVQKELQELIEKTKNDAEKNLQKQINEFKQLNATAEEQDIADLQKQEKEVIAKEIAAMESSIRAEGATALQQENAELARIAQLKNAQENQIQQATQTIQQLEQNKAHQIATMPHLAAIAAQENQIVQATQAIQQLEQNKAQQIASVPAHLRALNQAAINTFTNSVNQQIAATQKGIGEMRNHLQQMNTAKQTTINTFTNAVNQQIAEIQKDIGEMRNHLQLLNNAIAAVNQRIAEMPSRISALITSATGKITDNIRAQVTKKTAEIRLASSQDLSNLIDEYTRKVRKKLEDILAEFQANAPKAIQEAQKNEALRILDLLNIQNIERINTVEEHTRHFTQTLLTVPEIVEHKLSEHYTSALMGFTGQDLAKQTGDRFQIIGGCGMSLPNLTSQPISDGERFYQIATSACPEKPEEAKTFEFNNKSFAVFRMQVADNNLDPEINEIPVPASSEKALSLLEEMCESEEALLSPIPPEITQVVLDKSGAKLIHYASAFLEKARLVQFLASSDQISMADLFGNLPIHVAAFAGNADAVEALITLDPLQREAKNRSGATALTLAVQYGKYAVVEKLLSLGVQVNHRLPNGLFPLYIAVQNNYADIAFLLVERGLNLAVSEKLDSGMTALHLTIDNEQPDVALRLIEKGADLEVKRKADGCTPWHCAATQGQLGLMKAMAARGLSVHLALESGKTALHLAAEAGHLDTVQYLVTSGLIVDEKTKDGDTALMLAIKMGHTFVAESLARLSAINTVNFQSQTASVLALQYGMPTVSDILINRGENSGLCDRHGYSYVYYLVRNDEYSRLSSLVGKQTLQLQQQFNGESLSAIAARYGHFLMTYALLDLNVEITSIHNECTLIHYATMADEVDVLREWLMEHKVSEGDLKSKGLENKAITLPYLAAKHGSRNCLALLLNKINLKEMESQGLLSAAIDSGDTEGVKKILRHWKDINVPIDEKGNTALHYAASLGSVKMVELLMKHGSHPHLSNHEGKTPFHIALHQDDDYILKRLFKLTPPHEWPLDLKQVKGKKISGRIEKILEKYNKQLSVEEEKSFPSESRTQENASSSSFNVPHEDLDALKAILNDEAFDEAADFLEQKPLLLAEFKSVRGGELLQAIFSNVFDYSFLNKALTKEKLDDIEEVSMVPTPDRLLILLKNQGVDPATCQCSGNALLGIVNAKTDKEACYRLELFSRYFAPSLTTLAHASVMPNVTIADLAVKRNLRGFFMKLDELCSLQRRDGLSYCLHDVVCDDNYEWVESLLKSYPADLLNDKKQTPLMLAASKNNTRIMALLLSYGAMPDKVDLHGRNALHYALQHQSESAALYILPLLRRRNSPDRQGLTPLSLAAMQGILPVVRYLCREADYTQTVDDLGHNALHKAAITGQKEVIKYLVLQGFAIDQVEAPIRPSKIKRCQKRTPLHLAALAGKAEAVGRLLSLGADPKKTDAMNFTVCEYAILSKDIDTLHIIKQLPLYHDKERDTPLLHAACIANHGDVLRELILDGVNLNAVNAYGSTALHLAATHNSGEIADILLQSEEAALDLMDSQGNTPLHIAAMRGHVRLIEAIIKAGSDINKPNRKKQSPLFLAYKHRHQGAALALIKNKAIIPQGELDKLRL